MPNDTLVHTNTSPRTDLIKAQLKPALKALSREDILDLGDFLFEEARRRKDNANRAWRYPPHAD